MKECRAAENPPWISKKWLVRPHCYVKPAKVVEESEIVVDLEYERWYGHCQCGEVDPSNPSRVCGWKERLGTGEERFDLHPGNYIMGEVGGVEKRCC